MFIFILRIYAALGPNHCIVSALTYRYKKSGWRPKCKTNTIMLSAQVIIQKLVPVPAYLYIEYSYYICKKAREVDAPGLNCKPYLIAIR
ncbi:hypothetical protein D3C72_551580 [compost metagenome]